MPQSKIRRYLRHGTLPQLSVFEAVARLGSFTRAAEELYMAQPTVSVQIKKLTETIGLPVLEQVGKTVRLTPVGRELQTVCSEIFATLTRFEQRVADLLLHVLHRPEHTLAEVPLVAVPQLGGLVGTRAGPARYRRPAAGTRQQLDLDLDGRVAAGVEDLAAGDVGDGAHGGPSQPDRAVARVV